MLKHVILWKLKKGLSESEAQEAKMGIKEALEALKGVVPGLLQINVETDPLPGSNADIYLDSTFEDENALKVYAEHPAHVKIKDELVVPNVESRVCMDFFVK